MKHSPEFRQLLRALPLIVIGGLFLNGFALWVDIQPHNALAPKYKQFPQDVSIRYLFKVEHQCTCLFSCPWKGKDLNVKNQYPAFLLKPKIDHQVVITKAKEVEKRVNKKIYYPPISIQMLNGRGESESIFKGGIMGGCMSR